MDGKRALYYAAIGIAVLIGVSIVVSVVSALLSLAWAIVSGIVSLAVLAGVVYVLYKTGAWLLGGDDADYSASDSVGGSRSASASTDAAAESRQDRLRRQYVEGQISEAEFERRIASELETEEPDDVDRKVADIEQELERER
ncbi:hypothetical protein [Halorubrum kocurii]|uniref:SHOCT domain-containing protein n=1 Tax=Halorubrum kocurii JCM 14978 TaxID=1230456 RepID=M0P0I0_9EURY|nr:hypothetical protein [Halorubrum kocurii]EMA62330.1 hypothetical protein C468_11012 [Halorubrum kocurii JCM 14978]